jgi:hypothetical protein
MNATHFKNKSGHIVAANEWLLADWKNLELEPIYQAAIQPDEAVVEKYAAMTVTELRALCKERGITGYSKMNEAELIDVLMES